MKKIILSSIFALASLSANAIVGPFGLLEPEELKVDRPLFNLYYTDLQTQTLDGNVEAYLEGGLRYYYGYSRRLDVQTAKDYPTAARWFYEAAMKGSSTASYYLGFMYLRGQGVKAEYKAAIYWLSKASKEGLSQAKYMLSYAFYQMYLDKRFPESYRDFYYKQALVKLKELDNLGDPRGLYASAYLTLKYEDLTRFTQATANDYLLRAMQGFVLKGERANAYETLKMLKFNKLEGYKQAEELFNKNFPDKQSDLV